MCEAPDQLLLFSACWVFSCFRNPPNSDMEYRIFIDRTWSFLCVRIHTGVGHTDSESAEHFWLWKTQFFCVLVTGFKPRSFGSRVRRSTTRSPVLNITSHSHETTQSAPAHTTRTAHEYKHTLYYYTKTDRHTKWHTMYLVNKCMKRTHSNSWIMNVNTETVK